MRLYPTEEETIVGTARDLRARSLSCVDVVQRCLAKIDEREHEVKAWVSVDRQQALKHARVLDRELANGEDRGPLHGIPFGIKDIIDVAGWPTGAGFAAWSDRIASQDAPLVAALRSSGAIILGKTVTTAFAWIDPSITRNPWNVNHTPGGSSSGSAAAVASGMCLGALGTQTGGSVIRPASFCGVVAFKPRRQSLPTGGIVPFARSLDTPGLFVRSVEDLRVTYSQLLAKADDLGKEINSSHSQDPTTWSIPARQPVRVGRPVGVIFDRADASMKSAIESAYTAILNRGTAVVDCHLPVGFDEIHPIHRIIMAVEAAEAHEPVLKLDREQLPPKIRAIWEEGLAATGVKYLRAVNQRAMMELAFNLKGLGSVNPVEFLVMPAAIGAAPDLATTGDPWMNSPWTMLGHPVITIPAGLDSRGLPLGIQLVAPWKANGNGESPEFVLQLFAEAQWIEQTIRQSLGY